MNTSKHTPGPWIADRNGLGELAIFTAKGKHTLSCEGDSPLPLRQREANAELQAAAPAMYEALKALVEYLDTQVQAGKLDDWKHVLVARQALAQAEGQA